MKKDILTLFIERLKEDFKGEGAVSVQYGYHSEDREGKIWRTPNCAIIGNCDESIFYEPLKKKFFYHGTSDLSFDRETKRFTLDATLLSLLTPELIETLIRVGNSQIDETISFRYIPDLKLGI